MSTTPHIFVVGAGLTGLSAALHCQAQGAQVTLLDAAAHAGGRTRGVNIARGIDISQGMVPAYGVNMQHSETDDHPVNDDLNAEHVYIKHPNSEHPNTEYLMHAHVQVDNGQHLALGAYRDTLALLTLACLPESAVFTRLPLALRMHGGSRQIHLCAPSFLPAPIHLLVALLTARGLRLADKWQAMRWLQHLKKQRFQCASQLTVAALLRSSQQSTTLVTWLWEPLCLAALNTPIEEASAQTFLRVLQDSFFAAREDSDFLVFRHDLSQGLIQPLLASFIKQGGRWSPLTTVKQVQVHSNGYRLTSQRGHHQADGVIVAVAPHQRAHLHYQSQPIASPNTYQCISTVYLQYASDFCLPFPIMGMCEGIAHWVFDRGACCQQPGLLAVVISAHGTIASKAAWIHQIQAEINAALAPYGLQLPHRLYWSKVITEKRATFSCTPDDHGSAQRPDTLDKAYTRLDTRCYLAGDDQVPHYPATMESAVRSGRSAASQLMRSFG